MARSLASEYHKNRKLSMSITQSKFVIFWLDKKKVDEIFLPLLPQKKVNWFWSWIIVQPFFLPFCSREAIAFFSEQEPPPSFLPYGAKPLRLEHEPSQNLIRICQFVIIYKIWMIILKISAHCMFYLKKKQKKNSGKG